MQEKHTKTYENPKPWINVLSDNRTTDVNIAHLNVRSVRKNFTEIITKLRDALIHLDVLIFTEINLKKDLVSMYQLPGFEMFAACRENRRGGGILMYVHEDHVFQRESTFFTSCESLAGIVQVRGVRLQLLAVYRPPTSVKAQSKVPVFVRELASVVNSVPRDRDLVIIGDININTLIKRHTDTVLYEDTLSECGLLNTIFGVTREEIRDSRLIVSCLDHILVRQNKLYNFKSNIVRCGTSDHHLVYIGLSINSIRQQVKKTKLIFDNSSIKQDLKNTDWSELLQFQCPLLMYEKICKIFEVVYNENIKSIKIRNNKLDACPWLTKDIRNCIIHKDNLYKQWRSCPNDMAKRLEYTRYRNKTFKLLNKSKNLHRKELLKQCKGNSKKVWEHINNWLGRNKKSLDEVIMQHMGTKLDIQSICANFAHTFATEVVQLKAEHNCNTKLLNRQNYSKTVNASMGFTRVTASQVIKIIEQLDIHMSPGFDQLRLSDLKDIKTAIGPLIAKMINLFVQQCKYPDHLKISIVRPIYKSGSHSETTNYRPIAILSCINKIIEKALTGQIHRFLSKHDVIAHSQFGFQKGKSTSSLLSNFANDINNYLNNKHHVGVIFIDFRKAFDTLDHDVLLKSMETCGIRGKLNAWFREYLSQRKLTVKVNNYTGRCEDVRYGVATGSVTGPACYIMHVNSMPNVINHCKIYMFADDTCLLYSHKDQNVIQQCLQDDFDNITRWAHDNGIILNVKKTNVMCISSTQKKRTLTLK